MVILSAGASIASCRYDKNDEETPVLANIVEILNLESELEPYSFPEEKMNNFELLFSDIHGNEEYAELENLLISRVQDYFASLQIPDEVTIYDYLVLSLTGKDCIISFNWDPFLIQAYRRNITVGNLPRLVFPHGNVGVGISNNCKTKGYADSLCPNCYQRFENMPLLFPIDKKDYSMDSVIKNEWKEANYHLNRAAEITVLGYAATETDTDALDLLKRSYSKSNITEIAPFSIINLKSEKAIQELKWKEIYSNRMLDFVDEFKDSILWLYPKVSLKNIFDAILQQQP